MRHQRNLSSTQPLPIAVEAASHPQKQDEVNRAVYNSPGVYRYYLSERLTPAESVVLSRYRSNIEAKDVLDIGVGAGRTTRHLAPLAHRYEAVDYSAVMVGYIKKKMPEISVRQADFRDLSVFGDQTFDFMLATDNVIDALSHQGRLQALKESHRVLRPGGLLAFSAHNLNYKNAFLGPQLRGSANPIRFAANCAGYLLSQWNHHRVAPLRTTTAEYALINDPGHRFACLHYYAAHSTVRSQLTSAGLQLIEALDRAGQVVTEAQDDSDNPHIFYVARRV